MSSFPDTPVTMLARIAAQHTCESEASWASLFALYEPVIRKCAASLGAGSDDEDVAQVIFIKLVDVLRNGRYSADGGRFRSYLATLIRNELISRWRKANARMASKHCSIDDSDVAVELVAADDVAIDIDAKWYRARHEAAVEHVPTKTLLSCQSKAVYRAYVLEETPVSAVMERFGLPQNSVYQIKTRVEKMIAAVEAEMGD